jgi:hypothetical protein
MNPEWNPPLLLVDLSYQDCGVHSERSGFIVIADKTNELSLFWLDGREADDIGSTEFNP